MKKAIYLFLAVTFAGFSAISCSDDDNGGGNSSSIVGKWELQKIGVIINGQEFLENVQPDEGCSEIGYIEFRQNGTAFESSYWFNGSTCVEETDEYAYVVSGNTITLDGESATIMTLNSTTLKVKSTSFDGEEDEEDEEMTFVSVFKRI